MRITAKSQESEYSKMSNDNMYDNDTVLWGGDKVGYDGGSGGDNGVGDDRIDRGDDGDYC